MLKLWCCIPDTLLSLHCETLKNLLPHQRAISTLSEVFLQNHGLNDIVPIPALPPNDV